MIKTLTANQKMAELFQRNKSTISRYIFYVFESVEMKPDSVVAKKCNRSKRGQQESRTKHRILQPRCNSSAPATKSIPTAESSSASDPHKYCASILSVEINLVESFEKEAKQRKK